MRLLDSDIPEETIIYHSDPFYAECRAFGRITSQGLNGKVAVRCHGYMRLSSEWEEKLSKQFGISDWKRPDEEYDQIESKRESFRAIVKSVIDDETPFTESMVPKMRDSLWKLRKLNIYARDIRESNYRRGQLLDFSVSWTKPHFMLEDLSEVQVEVSIDEELADFDEMISAAGISTPIRASPDRAVLKKLRPKSHLPWARKRYN